jgi:hypothetical protein
VGSGAGKRCGVCVMLTLSRSPQHGSAANMSYEYMVPNTNDDPSHLTAQNLRETKAKRQKKKTKKKKKEAHKQSNFISFPISKTLLLCQQKKMYIFFLR